MAEYIKRDDAIKAIEWTWAGKAAFEALKNLPAADVEERSSVCPHYIRNVHDRGDDSLCEKYVCEVKVTKPKWIPVTEKLPEKEKRTYWICTDTGYQCECRWTNNRFGIGESDEWGWNIADVPQYHKVTAWMFLPEPYEPPKEEP